MAADPRPWVEMRCPQCRRYVGQVHAGEEFRGYCRQCRFKWEQVARPGGEPAAMRSAHILTARERVRIMRIGT